MPILNMSKKNLNRMAKKPEGQSYLSFYRQAMSQVAVHKKKKHLPKIMALLSTGSLYCVS